MFVFSPFVASYLQLLIRFSKGREKRLLMPAFIMGSSLPFHVNAVLNQEQEQYLLLISYIADCVLVL